MQPLNHLFYNRVLTGKGQGTTLPLARTPLRARHYSIVKQVSVKNEGYMLAQRHKAGATGYNFGFTLQVG